MDALWTRTSPKQSRADVSFRYLMSCEPNSVPPRRARPLSGWALGEAYSELGYVVCNEAGEPYHPSTMSTMWQAAISKIDVPQVRLHDARHIFATLMHLQGVPIALVAAWLGHADISFTMRTYVHAQADALELAARSFAARTSSAEG